MADCLASHGEIPASNGEELNSFRGWRENDVNLNKPYLTYFLLNDFVRTQLPSTY
jgi:hypothetical protein